MTADLKTRLEHDAFEPTTALDVADVLRRGRRRRRNRRATRIAVPAVLIAGALAFGVAHATARDHSRVNVLTVPPPTGVPAPTTTTEVIPEPLGDGAPAFGAGSLPAGYFSGSGQGTTAHSTVTASSATSGPITVDQWTSDDALGMLSHLIDPTFTRVPVRETTGYRSPASAGPRVLVWNEDEYVAIRITAPDTLGWNEILRIASGLHPAIATGGPTQVVRPPGTP